MFHPSSNTARTQAHTSISTLKSLVNFCSRDFLFHKKFDDSTLAKRHIVVGHFLRSDTGHVMQAIDVTRHSRITQQLVPSTTILSFVCCSQFACKKMLLMTFGTTLVCIAIICGVKKKRLFCLCIRAFWCYTRSRFSVTFHCICQFTASSDVRFFCFATLFTSLSYFTLGFPLHFLPPNNRLVTPRTAVQFVPFKSY